METKRDDKKIVSSIDDRRSQVYIPVEVDVVAVDGAVEGDGDHLGHLGWVDVAGHPGAVGRAEAVWQLALAQVAVGGPVRILPLEE